MDRHVEGLAILAFLSHWEVLLVIALLLLLFGGRASSVARSMGKGLGELKRGVRGLKEASGLEGIQSGAREIHRQVAPRTLMSDAKKDRKEDSVN